MAQGRRSFGKTSSGAALLRRKDERHWNHIHPRYASVGILGAGTYGTVYKADCLVLPGRGSEPWAQNPYIPKGTKQVALKRCALERGISHGVPDTALREVGLMADIRHKNVLGQLECSCNTKRLYIVTELLDEDLKQTIKRANRHSTPLSPGAVKWIILNIIEGVHFLHANRILHRDLKPHNVLMSRDLRKIKVADLGLARGRHAGDKTITHEVVTLWYRAPEVLLGDCVYDDRIDVWSIGCILAELLIGRPLFAGESELDTLVHVMNLLGTPEDKDWPPNAMQSSFRFPRFPPYVRGTLTSAHESIDSLAEDFLLRSLEFNFRRRATTAELLQHPYLADVTYPMLGPAPTSSELETEARTVGGLAPRCSDSTFDQHDQFLIRKHLGESGQKMLLDWLRN